MIQTLMGFSLLVRPKGLEPLSLVPETKILSIELRAQKFQNNIDTYRWYRKQ